MYKDEGYQLMGAAFEVYNQLGYGMAEEVYQQSLEIELRLRNLPFATKRELRLVYKGRELDTRYVPDLFVFDAIVVELKAVKELVAEHEAQLFNYLRLAQQPVGYLINFGQKEKLEWNRYILSDLRKRPDRREGFFNGTTTRTTCWRRTGTTTTPRTRTTTWASAWQAPEKLPGSVASPVGQISLGANKLREPCPAQGLPGRPARSHSWRTGEERGSHPR